MNMPEPSTSAPSIPMLDTLAAKAGFRRTEAPLEDELTTRGLELWRSDFAILALVRVPEADAASLDQTFNHASEWISRLLKAEEKKGRLIDGYLLLAMPSKPDGALLAQVRRVESDTSICRKHVLWPEPDLSWSSTLNAVTTLGLPSTEPVSGEVTEPLLPWAAGRALEARANGLSFDDVASLIEELPEDESESNQHAN